MSLLVAVEIILSRFLSISAWNIKIGLSFVPIVVAAICFGPLEAGIVAALSDLLGALLFPIGPYFPGFTLTAFLTGCVFGLFLKKNPNWLRCIAAVAINQFLLSLFLNTLWISMLYGSPFVPLLETRLIQCVLLFAVQLIGVRIILSVFERYGKKVSSK